MGSLKNRRTASANHLLHIFMYHESFRLAPPTPPNFRAAMLQHGGAVPAAALHRSGSGLKKAKRWLKRSVAIGNATLNPLLRPSSLLQHQVGIDWDVTRFPLPMQNGIPISAMFDDPATTPPTAYMSLLIPIPGLPDRYWVCKVRPVDLGPPGSPGSPDFPATPYAMPDAFFPYSGSPVPLQDLAWSPTPVVTTAAVLLAVHTALHQHVKLYEYFALTPERQNRVGKAFWRRHRMGSTAEAWAVAQRGMQRLDFLEDKMKWEGLVPLGMGKWLVLLGRP